MTALNPQTTVYQDSYDSVEFVIPAGAISQGSEWVHYTIVHHRELLIREIWAAAVGADTSPLLNNSNVVLEHSARTLFERPLSVLVKTVENHNADIDRRLERLERMINVLVEQDSPAGEALRRLGGAKVDTYQNFTRLIRPVQLPQGDSYVIRLRAQGRFDLESAVIVRISVIGVKTWSV